MSQCLQKKTFNDPKIRRSTAVLLYTVLPTYDSNTSIEYITTNFFAFLRYGLPQFFCVFSILSYVGSVVEWLMRRVCDQHGLGSKPTRAILLCPWERHFTALSHAWWSWQAVLNYSHISIKLQADSNILASPEAGRGNLLPYVLAPPSLSCESEG